MGITFRSVLTVGVATVTATAVAFGPSVQEPTRAAPSAPIVAVRSAPVDLAAQVQPLAVTDLPNLLAGWVERFIVPPSASQAFPAPPSGPAPAPQSLTGTLEWAYHAIEPWVRYGFEVATYAVGWIPWVGWLSGQIMIFYNFGESIVHAIAHNTLDWLSGNGSFLQNVGDGIAWTIDAFIQLGIDQWNFWLPPLPPLPPFPLAATTATSAENLTTLAADVTTQPKKIRDAIKGEDVAGLADETTVDGTTVDGTTVDGTTVDETTVNETTVNETTVNETTVNETTKPKAPKAPKEPKAATEAAAEGDVGSVSNADSPSPKNDSPSPKKKAEKSLKGEPPAKADNAKGETTKKKKKNDAGKKDDE